MRAVIDVRPLSEEDREWAVEVEVESGGEPVVARLGELVDPTELPGFVAFLDRGRAGLVTYAVRGSECDIVTIRSLQEGKGIARALLDAVRGRRDPGRLQPALAGNDQQQPPRIGDLPALGHGHRSVPSQRSCRLPQAQALIPARDSKGIPIAHELELELRLD